MPKSHHDLRPDNGNWSAADEAAFLVLQQRRARNNSKARMAVYELFSRMFSETPAHKIDRLTTRMIDNAEQVRDALAWYDKRTTVEGEAK